VLIETGTFLGDNVYRLRDDFERIVSIELDPWLARHARRRFAGLSYISILEGDSGSVLPVVLGQLKEPAVFWLDAHWSGGLTGHGHKETPVADELSAILCHPLDSHAVLIDDAQFLGARPDYPPLEALCALVHRQRPSWVCDEAVGIVRLHNSRLLVSKAST
jgi:hypothetical protein